MRAWLFQHLTVRIYLFIKCVDYFKKKRKIIKVETGNRLFFLKSRLSQIERGLWDGVLCSSSRSSTLTRAEFIVCLRIFVGTFDLLNMISNKSPGCYRRGANERQSNSVPVCATLEPYSHKKWFVATPTPLNLWVLHNQWIMVDVLLTLPPHPTPPTHWITFPFTYFLTLCIPLPPAPISLPPLTPSSAVSQ